MSCECCDDLQTGGGHYQPRDSPVWHLVSNKREEMKWLTLTPELCLTVHMDTHELMEYCTVYTPQSHAQAYTVVDIQQNVPAVEFRLAKSKHVLSWIVTCVIMYKLSNKLTCYRILEILTLNVCTFCLLQLEILFYLLHLPIK